MQSTRPADGEPDAPSAPTVARISVAWCIAVAAWSLWGAATSSIWIDEAYSLHTAMGSLSRTLKQAVGFERQGPLFFLVLNLWIRLAPNVPTARALPYACVVLAAAAVFFALWKGARAKLDVSWLGTAITLGMPYSVWAAAELRCYAMAMAFAALLLALAVRLLFAPPRSHPWRLECGYIAAVVLGFLTFYPVAIIAGAMAAASLLLPQRIRLVRPTAIAALLSSLWLPQLLQQSSGNWGYEDHSLALARETPGTAVVAGLRLVVFGLTRTARLDRPWLALALTMLCAGGLLLFARKGRARGDRSTVHPLVSWSLLALLFAVAAFICLRVAIGPLFGPRYVGLLTPLVGLVTAIVYSLANKNLRLQLAIAALAALALCNVSARRNMWKEQNWHDLATRLLAEAAPGEVLLVFPATQEVALRVYVPTHSSLLGLPHEACLDEFRLSTDRLPPALQTAKSIRSMIGARAGWLITTTNVPEALNPHALDSLSLHGIRIVDSFTTTGLRGLKLSVEHDGLLTPAIGSQPLSLDTSDPACTQRPQLISEWVRNDP